MEAQKNKTIAVIGLGLMGKRLAELLVENKYDVLVWNRTIAKAHEINGVRISNNVEEAIQAASVIVICVYDYNAVKSILYSIIDQRVLDGKTVINFTTGSPAEVGEIESLLSSHHAYYINGALQVAPDQMGLKDTTILVAGNQSAFDKELPLLTTFGGNLQYLGEKAPLASAVDLATLSWLYGSYIGLIYAIELCTRSGVKLDIFSRILADIAPGFTEYFQHQIDTVAKNDFTVSQSPLGISIGATQRIKNVVQEHHLSVHFWESITNLFSEADKMDLSRKELASIIQVIRKPSEQPTMQLTEEKFIA